MYSTLDAIQHAVPAKDTIGYVLGNDDWDYPLYGARFERRILKLPAREPLARAQELGIDWVVVGDVESTGSPGWTAIRFHDSGWSLIVRSGGTRTQALEQLARAVNVQAKQQSAARASAQGS
jgi:hypothetical protein